MDGLGHFSLADAVVCGAFANLEGNTGIEARVAVAKRNAHVDHGIGIRLVEGADSGCIGVTVMTITDSEACFISRVEIKRMERCQSIAAGCRSVDIRIQTAVRVVHVAVNLLRVGSSQAVDVADVSRTVRVVSIADNTSNDAALAILAIDINLRRSVGTANLDGLAVAVNEVASLLNLRIEADQVLGRRVGLLDVRAISRRTEFVVDGIARNKALVAAGDFTIAIDANCKGLRTVFCFIRNGYIITAFDIHCVLRQALDDRLAFIREAFAIFDLGDVSLDFCIRVFTSRLFIKELTAVDGIFTVLAYAAIFDISNSCTLLAG